MSSDYIPRLRQELLRAGATRPARVRPARLLRPVAATAVALAAVLAVIALWDPPADETPVAPPDAVTLDYGAQPVGTAEVMRQRLAAAGVEGARVATRDGALTITVPVAERAELAPLGQPGRLAVHDWERSVVGGAAPVSRAEAESRAARNPGARVVRGEREGWHALRGEPALTNADVVRRAVAAGGSFVDVPLTTAGRERFTALTRDVARRGARAGELQHIALVLDGRVVGVPFIDHRQAPDGLRADLRIPGGSTAGDARRMAALLSAGPLDAPLR